MVALTFWINCIFWKFYLVVISRAVLFLLLVLFFYIPCSLYWPLLLPLIYGGWHRLQPLPSWLLFLPFFSFPAWGFRFSTGADSSSCSATRQLSSWKIFRKSSFKKNKDFPDNFNLFLLLLQSVGFQDLHIFHWTISAYTLLFVLVKWLFISSTNTLIG